LFNQAAEPETFARRHNGAFEVGRHVEVRGLLAKRVKGEPRGSPQECKGSGDHRKALLLSRHGRSCVEIPSAAAKRTSCSASSAPAPSPSMPRCSACCASAVRPSTW